MQKAKNMEIDVIVTKANNPKGVTFELDAGNGKTQSLDFKNDKHPGIMIYFNIVDPDKTGLLFKPTPSNALWVESQGTPPACPASPSTWNQFVPLSVERNGKQLIVYNRNKSQKQFAFTFWFDWPDGTSVDYDPIGNNQNGQRE